MARKTKEYHHLDSNVLLGILVPTDEKLRISCKAYADRIGFAYRAGLSIHILGEIHKKIQEDLAANKNARDAALDFLDRLISKRKVAIHSLVDKDLELCGELREIETRADVPELLALCVAIREKANVFMTADKEMFSDKLRNHLNSYKITVKHPFEG